MSLDEFVNPLETFCGNPYVFWLCLRRLSDYRRGDQNQNDDKSCHGFQCPTHWCAPLSDIRSGEVYNSKERGILKMESPAVENPRAVSYTHLTLPTSDLV